MNIAADNTTGVDGCTTGASNTATRSFGEEITSTTNDRIKFATYTRDSYTGLDYAKNRFYASSYGRFNTPDHSWSSVSGLNPQSWNRYSYVLGDPVNSNDPNGLCTVMIAGITMGPGSNATWSAEAADLGAVTAYPYQGEGAPASIASVIQQLAGPNDSTAAAYAAIIYAISSSTTPVDIIAYSGGAAAFTAAWGELTSLQKAMIGQILYIAPGSAGAPLAHNGQTSYVFGNGAANFAATFGNTPVGGSVTNTNCAHTDLSCFFSAAPGTSEFNALTSMYMDGQCSSPEQFTRTSPAGVPAPQPVASGGGVFSGWVIIPWADTEIDVPWDGDGSMSPEPLMFN